MLDDIPILGAKNISEFIDALNKKYQLNLPTATTFPEDSPLLELWQNTPIQVTTENGESASYTAIGNLTFVPFNFAMNFDPSLKARVIITVHF